MKPTFLMRGGWLSCILLLLGCSAPSPTVAVEGVVTYEGKPLPMANITMVPVEEGTMPAMAIADNDGVFRPHTVGEGKGILPGQYKVLVMAANDPGGPKVPSIYADVNKTPLSITLPVEGRFELKLSKSGK